MAGDRIDPKQVAFFFEAYPGVNWIAEGIPLLPGNGSPHERDLNALIAPIEVLKVYGSSVELTLRVNMHETLDCMKFTE